MHKKVNKIILFIQKLACLRAIMLSLLGFVIVMMLVNVVFRQDFSYLTQTFNYTPEYTYQLLNEIGASGITSHLLVFLPDILMVLLYTALFLGANYAIFTQLTSNCLFISIITFSPLILSITQIVEIIMLTILLLQYPSQLFFLAQLTNTVTMIKTVLTIIFFLVPLIGIGALGVKRIIKRGRKNE